MGSDQKANAGSEFWLDEERRLLRIKLWGMWKQADLEAFQRGFREQLKKLGRGPFCVYADISECPPQNPEIADGCQQMMVSARQAGMTRAANIVHHATTKLQIKRMSNEAHTSNFRFFNSEKEAMAWLLEETV